MNATLLHGTMAKTFLRPLGLDGDTDSTTGVGEGKGDVVSLVGRARKDATEVSTEYHSDVQVFNDFLPSVGRVMRTGHSGHTSPTEDPRESVESRPASVDDLYWMLPGAVQV